jgi:hypothetical protein
MNVMKTIYLFCIIQLLAGSSLSAQLWFQADTEWHFNWNSWSQQGYETIQTAGDTLIEGQLCQKLERQLVTVDAIFQYQDTSVVDLEPYFMYESNDSVFVLQDDTFQLMYDFNLEPGDSLAIRVDLLEESPCPNLIYFVLDSVVTLITPYDILRMQYGRMISDIDPVNGPKKVQILEGVGMVEASYEGDPEVFKYGYLRPEFAYQCIVDGQYWNFCSFRQGEFTYNPGNEDCDFLPPPVSVEEILSEDLIRAYPNPARDVLHLEWPADFTFRKINIYSSTGFHLKTLLSPQQEIPLSDLPKGMLVVMVEMEEGIVAKRIVKE